MKKFRRTCWRPVSYTHLDVYKRQQRVNAFVPLAQRFGYATDLRSKTQGRGQYVMEPSHYEPVPKNIADQIIAGRTKG